MSNEVCDILTEKKILNTNSNINKLLNVFRNIILKIDMPFPFRIVVFMQYLSLISSLTLIVWIDHYNRYQLNGKIYADPIVK